MFTKYTVIKEERGFMLLGADDGQRTVISVNDGQVQDAMPGDAPNGGGHWYSGMSDNGVDYVSSLYSRSYANRTFRRLVSEAAEYDF